MICYKNNLFLLDHALQVGQFSFTRFGDPAHPENHQYTVEDKQSYAKPGTPVPIVKIFVKDMSAHQTDRQTDRETKGQTDRQTDGQTDDYQEVIPPKEFLDKYGREEHSVFATYWITDEKLGVLFMNRFQNASSTSGK
jgi:hypothetical protein